MALSPVPWGSEQCLDGSDGLHVVAEEDRVDATSTGGSDMPFDVIEEDDLIWLGI